MRSRSDVWGTEGDEQGSSTVSERITDGRSIHSETHASADRKRGAFLAQSPLTASGSRPLAFVLHFLNNFKVFLLYRHY